MKVELQVPLLISMNEEESALNKAIESGDTDLGLSFLTLVLGFYIVCSASLPAAFTAISSFFSIVLCPPKPSYSSSIAHSVCQAIAGYRIAEEHARCFTNVASCGNGRY